MLKIFPIFLLSAVFALLLTACGSDSRHGSESATTFAPATIQMTSDQTETTSRETAVRLAQNYVRDSNISRRRVIRALISKGFSAEDAASGADHCGADWMEEALACAKAYIETNLYGIRILVALETEDGFTAAEAAYAVERMDPQPQKTAVRFAQTYVRGSAISRQRVIDSLINDGFAAKDATYGADHCGVDWMAQAVKCLKKYWISDPGYRDELINTLKAEKFTEEEAAYAVNYAMKLSAEPKNFVYSCLIDKQDGKGLIRYTVSNIDVKKFEQLLEFCAANSYDPLGSNAGKQTRRLPYGVVKETEIRFGRESENGFTSEGAGRFYVWEGKLVLLWYTSGEDYTLVADVPDSLGQYFIKLMGTLKNEG